MALADILRDIEHDADAEIARIRADAEHEAEALLQAARSAADVASDEMSEARRAGSDETRQRLVAQAETEATATLREAREDVFARVLARVRERLAGLRSEPTYGSVLRSLVVEALDALPDATTVVADPRDAEAVDSILAEVDPSGGRGLLVEPALETWGGVEVSATDARVVVRNTLEERLERATGRLRPLVARVVPDLAAEGEVRPC